MLVQPTNLLPRDMVEKKNTTQPIQSAHSLSSLSTSQHHPLKTRMYRIDEREDLEGATCV